MRVVRYAFQRRHDILVSILLNRLRCLSTALDLNPSRKMKTNLSFKLAGKIGASSFHMGQEVSLRRICDEAFARYEMAPCRRDIGREYATMSRGYDHNYRSTAQVKKCCQVTTTKSYSELFFFQIFNFFSYFFLLFED